MLLQWFFGVRWTGGLEVTGEVLAGKDRAGEERWEGVGQLERERKKFEYSSCKQQCWRVLLSFLGCIL